MLRVYAVSVFIPTVTATQVAYLNASLQAIRHVVCNTEVFTETLKKLLMPIAFLRVARTVKSCVRLSLFLRKKYILTEFHDLIVLTSIAFSTQP